MSSLESRRLNHLESAIRAASGEQIVTIDRLVAEVVIAHVLRSGRARQGAGCEGSYGEICVAPGRVT
jgi:PHP family Zn ribbon phosphoesterase